MSVLDDKLPMDVIHSFSQTSEHSQREGFSFSLTPTHSHQLPEWSFAQLGILKECLANGNVLINHFLHRGPRNPYYPTVQGEKLGTNGLRVAPTRSGIIEIIK